MSRCYICDYTPEEGSDYADVPPGKFHLHETPLGFLCDECLNVSDENLFDLSDVEEDDDQE